IANVPAAVNTLTFNAEGTQLVAGLADNSVRVYDVAEGTEVKSLPGHTGAVAAVMFTPKGDEIITAGADKTIQRFTASDFSAKGKLEHAAAVSSLSVNKDGTKVAA